MKKYKIRYHFSNDFYVTREVESELDKSSVLMKFSEEERMMFEDKRGDLLSFFMRDVKLVTVEDGNGNTVKAGF
ncbi:hypothetical protein CEF21_09795 [Bacillus sp. FJAT-42376]|uniref:hypothetical protein n=1 Tax=Bacillus sp. FJAT-42376 TaxID=2014076 RepID=UPI000F4F9C72|nr:hypothetical protein [Bacillus sp. FJAT-42376]AZB42555.1 hypothetical protein CEF21_09795 [Bacillus sp. FJAT-42376]